MRRVRGLRRSGLATLGVLAGGLLFSAAPALAAAPRVVSETAPYNITPFEARLEATVNAGEELTGSTECHFQYGSTSVTEHEVACEQGTPPGTLEGGEQGVSLSVTGLAAKTIYHARVVVKNATGKAEGASEEFTTLTLVKPEVVSESASVKATEATLNAQVNPEYQETSCEFQYGTDASLTTSKTVPCEQKPLGSGGGATGASAALSGLEAGETYYYRVLATNATGTTTDPAIESFTTVPVPHTGGVEALTATTATFTGALKPLNETAGTEYFFYYNVGEEPACNGESSTTPVGPATGKGGEVKASVPVTELQPHQKYSVCLVTTNIYGSEVATPPVYFTTPLAPPTVIEESAVTQPAGAKLLEKVNPNNQQTTCEFQYVGAAGYDPSAPNPYSAGTSTPCEQGKLNGYGEQGVTGELAGLRSHTTYDYRVVAENAAHETTYGSKQTFTIPGPLVESTSAPSTIAAASANVTGSVNPEGVETYYYYQHGPSVEYGQSTPTVGVGAGTGPVQAPATLVPLTPGVTYHYRLVAWNAEGTSYGQDETFTAVAGQSPTAVTGPASGISVNEATISGTINPAGKETSYRFEYGASTEYGTQAFGTVLPEQGEQTVALSLRGLEAGTTYHYRLVVSNPGGEAVGADETFTTPPIADPLVNPAVAPLVATLDIAFPTGSEANTGPTVETKKLTTVQKLQKALKQCHREPMKDRSKCEKQAHSRYGPAAKGKRKKK